MAVDDMECIYIDREINSAATYHQNLEAPINGAAISPVLHRRTRELLQSFARVHLCSNISQILRILDSRSSANPAATALLVSLGKQDFAGGVASYSSSNHTADSNVSSDNLDALEGLALLQYLNGLKKRRRFECVLTVACIEETDMTTVRRLFDLGTDDFLRSSCSAEDIERLSLTLYKTFRNYTLPVADKAYHDNAKYEREDLTPTQTQWNALHHRVQTLYQQNSPSRLSILDEHLPTHAEPRASGASYYASEAYLLRVPELQLRVSSWAFNTLHMSEDELMDCAAVILKHLLSQPGTEEWHISDNDLYAFLDCVRMSYYSSNPYHNFRHAVDVMQAVFYMLTASKMLSPINDQCPQFDNGDDHIISKLISSKYMLGACIVGIGHDVGHPGVNNAFLVSTKAPLASLYNDKSVLENLHCAALSRILAVRWPATQEPSMRKVILELILSTDMALHFDYMSRFKEIESAYTSAVSAPDSVPAEVKISPDNIDKYRLTLFSALIKCGDISNVARPFPISCDWSDVLLREFFNQARLERSLDLPVTKMLDPELTRQADSQVFFTNLFAHPLFSSLARILPNLQPLVTTIVSNRETWKTSGRCDPSEGVQHAAAVKHNKPVHVAEPVSIPEKHIDSVDESPMAPESKVISSSSQAKRFFLPHFLKNKKNKEAK